MTKISIVIIIFIFFTCLIPLLSHYCTIGRSKIHTHTYTFSKIGFCADTKGFEEAQIFGLAQKIWTGTKHFGTCKRTRHKILYFADDPFFVKV